MLELFSVCFAVCLNRMDGLNQCFFSGLLLAWRQSPDDALNFVPKVRSCFGYKFVTRGFQIQNWRNFFAGSFRLFVLSKPYVIVSIYGRPVDNKSREVS